MFLNFQDSKINANNNILSNVPYSSRKLLSNKTNVFEYYKKLSNKYFRITLSKLLQSKDSLETRA